MLVRTISQLPETTSDFKDGKFEISIPESGSSQRYYSKSIKYTTISADLTQSLSSDIAKTYELTATNKTPIKVRTNLNSINNTLTGNVQISGRKNFLDWPWITKDFPSSFSNYGGMDGDYILPNVKKVRQLITETPAYFSTEDSTVAEGNPLPWHSNPATTATVPEALGFDQTIEMGKFYFWRIDDQGTDSGKAIHDDDSSTIDAYEEMRDTGNLVVWGWLADNGSVSPEMAWVGLFGWIKHADDLQGDRGNVTHHELPICIRPWIRGTNASSLQYVGFNIPVRKGMQLKIKTGFPVNGNNSGFQNPGSMTFMDRNVPNAFYGYIVK